MLVFARDDSPKVRYDFRMDNITHEERHVQWQEQNSDSVCYLKSMEIAENIDYA